MLILKKLNVLLENSGKRLLGEHQFDQFAFYFKKNNVTMNFLSKLSKHGMCENFAIKLNIFVSSIQMLVHRFILFI